jgi:putative FmdB family regulatory protein
MPLYEYACNRCGKRFEVRQKFADEPIKTHEECGGEAERLLSTPAFQFKGTGWYVTDYAKTGGGKSPSNGNADTKSEGKSEGKSESKSDGKSDSKSESAPAPKTETKSETKSSSETKST